MQEISTIGNDDIQEIYKELAASVLSTIELSSPTTCIYRVPERVRANQEEAYVPEIVSIGLFHHGKPNLQFMEQHKKWYLQAFLSRIITLTTSSASSSSSSENFIKSNLLKDLIKSIKELKTQTWECYTEIKNPVSDQFVQMMLLDGCFILEFLLRAYDYNSGISNRTNDPISGTPWMTTSLIRDLVLLENQIPIVVLETIFSFIPKHPQQLNNLVLSFFAGEFLAVQQVRIMRPIDEFIPKETIKHILDLLHNFLSPVSKFQDNDNGDGGRLMSVHCCATDLWDAGVIFEIKEDNPDGLLDVQFNGEDGVLQIPTIPFDRRTIVLLKNLVAMEQCDKNLNQLVSSYVLLLDMLIKSEKNVWLLRHQRIVENQLRNDQEMAETINSLRQGVTISGLDFYHNALCDRVNKYFKPRENRWSNMLKPDHLSMKCQEWKAMLKRDYFNSLWAVVSFIAAVLLLSFTFLQTIYTIRSYYPH